MCIILQPIIMNFKNAKTKIKLKSIASVIAVIGTLSVNTFTAVAQDSAMTAAANPAEVAKKLANPIASLISVPFQSNLDVGIGDNNGSRMVVNIQPCFSEES